MAAVKNLLFSPTVIPKLSMSFAIGNAGGCPIPSGKIR